MFLLPRLHANHLKRQVNMRQLRNALKELSSCVKDSIESSLQRVQNQNPMLRDISLRVLL